VSVSNARRGSIQPAPTVANASATYRLKREQITATGASTVALGTQADTIAKSVAAPKPEEKDKQDEPAPQKIASAPHLSTTALEDLNHRLSLLKQSLALKGQVVFEAIIQNGRVTRLLLVEEASTLSDPATLAALRLNLQSWVVPDAPSTTTRITLNF
jgi:hypothetical protein